MAQTDTLLMQRTSAVDLLALDSAQYRSAVTTAIANLLPGETREAPGVITVITAEEIAASGARDLMEALTLVPGMNLGRDMDDVIGVSIRGNWAEEGKCLFMVNGVFLNEMSYGTLGLGHRIPLGNVSRIEVISGPGSVIYGGFAALGVVNIITKDAREFEGVEAVVNAGMANGYNSRLNGQVYGSYLVGENTEVNYSIYSGTGKLSTERTLLLDGEEMSYGDSTSLENHQFTLAVRTPRTLAQVFFNDRNSQVSDGVHTLVQRDLLLDLEHLVPLGERTELILRSQYRNQLPWNWNDHPDVELSAVVDQRLSQRAIFRYQLLSWLDIRTGLSAYSEVTTFTDPRDEFITTGTRRIRAHDAALFSEATMTRRWGVTTIGGRAEKNTFSDLLFAPRFAWTKAWRHLHMKLLYSTAYRLPTHQNIELGPPDEQLGNEWTYTTEAEVGWRTGKSTEFSANAFRVDIRQPIVYVFSDDGSESYISRERAGTAGVEARMKYFNERLFLTLGFGNYHVVRSRTNLPEVELPAPYNKAYQSVPRHRAILVGSYKATGQISLETRLAYHGVSWSYQFNAQGEELELKQQRAAFITDLGVRYAIKALSGACVRLGVRDLFGQSGAITSPYATGLAPIPMNRRELTLEFRYHLGR